MVMPNDFGDDEVQKRLGKLRVQIRLFRQIFEPSDLLRFTRWIRRGKVVCGLEFPHGLRVFEPLAQRVDEDCIEPVNRGAMLLEKLCGAFGGGISQGPILSL